MSEYLESVVSEALGHYGERITRVESHISDANGSTKTGTDDIHCTREAWSVGLIPSLLRSEPPARTRLSRAQSKSSNVR